MAAMAVGWFAHTWASPTSRVVGSGADGWGVVWYFAWFPFALSHGLNPLFTHYVHFPAGNNLMWDPGMPLVAALVSPITATAGPIVAYNVVATAGPAVAGWAAFLAFRRWVAPFPALVGALLFGFSPVMAAQSAQHPFLTFSVTAPLLLIIGDRLLVVQRASFWRDGLWLGLLLWAQLLISEEVLTMEAVVAVIAVVVLAVVNRRAIAGRLRHAVRGLGVAVGVAAVLAAWPLAVQFLGPEQLGQVHPPGIYVSDLWSFVTPTVVTAISPASAQALASHFTGNWTEWGSYLGLPLLVFIVISIMFCRRRPVVFVALAVTTAAGVLSLGTSLHVSGQDTHIALPWALVSGLPMLQDLLPGRFSVIMWLGAGLLLALGLQEFWERGWVLRIGGYSLAGLAVASLVPVSPYLTEGVPTLDASALKAVCPARTGADVSLLPSDEEYVVLWQAQAGFCFTIPSRSSLTGVKGGPVDQLQQASNAATYGKPMPTLTLQLRTQVRDELTTRKTASIVIGPSGPPAVPTSEVRLNRWVTRLLGVPPRHVGNILIWRHPHVPLGNTPAAKPRS